MAAENADEPIEPLEIDAAAPVRNTYIDMACEGNACIKRALHDLCGEKAVGLLPHEQEPVGRRWFECEGVRKIQVRVEKNNLSARRASQKRIRNLSPAGMPVTQRPESGELAEAVRFGIGELMFRTDGPVMTGPRRQAGNYVFKDPLVLRGIGDQRKVKGFECVTEKTG